MGRVIVVTLKTTGFVLAVFVGARMGAQVVVVVVDFNSAAN